MKQFLLLITVVATTLLTYAQEPSRTLPIVYVNTVDSQPIDQKEVYISATAWIDACGSEDYPDLGSADAPLALGIRGRGQSSWTMLPKKPYKLKFDKKQAVLGLPKNKHWALLTLAWGGTCQFATQLGCEISKMMGLDWTPTILPVELVLNGSYEGIYWLAETVRIDENRVDMDEQPEDTTDPEELPYGWLVEIDNYIEPESVVIYDSTSTECIFKIHEPDPMNEIQRDWISTYLQMVTDVVTGCFPTDPQWENYIDAPTLARYFLVQELLNNDDSFVGSTYFYRSRADGGKLHFGPIWDIGDLSVTQKRTWNSLRFPRRHVWIGELARHASFWKYVRQAWNEYADNIDITALCNKMDALATQISPALAQDYLRWPELQNASEGLQPRTLASRAKAYIRSAYTWIDTHVLTDYPSFTISMRSPTGGNILVDGLKHNSSVEVMAGSDVTITFSPNSKYKLGFPTVDGIDYSSMLDGNSIKITNIMSDIALDAWFEQVLNSVTDIKADDEHTLLPAVEATSPEPGKIHIDAHGETVSVHDTSGTCIYTGPAATIACPHTGIYIASAAGHSSVKIAVAL